MISQIVSRAGTRGVPWLSTWPALGVPMRRPDLPGASWVARRPWLEMSLPRLGPALPGRPPTPDAAVRTALREVVGRCIYGVGVKPMAVELAKVSLWLEAMECGKPLTFIDANIKTGDSLLARRLASAAGELEGADSCWHASTAVASGVPFVEQLPADGCTVFAVV